MKWVVGLLIPSSCSTDTSRALAKFSTVSSLGEAPFFQYVRLVVLNPAFLIIDEREILFDLHIAVNLS